MPSIVELEATHLIVKLASTGEMKDFTTNAEDSFDETLGRIATAFGINSASTGIYNEQGHILTSFDDLVQDQRLIVSASPEELRTVASIPWTFFQIEVKRSLPGVKKQEIVRKTFGKVGGESVKLAKAVMVTMDPMDIEKLRKFLHGAKHWEPLQKGLVGSKTY